MKRPSELYLESWKASSNRKPLINRGARQAGKTGTLKSLQVYLGEKHKKTGIRFNLDVPSVGDNLVANININGLVQEVEYSLISLPLYMAYYLKQLI